MEEHELPRASANGCGWTGAGAAYGTAKAGIGIAGVGTFRPDLIMKVRERKLLYSKIGSADGGTTVTDPRGHGWDHRRLLARHSRADCRLYGSIEEIQSV